MKPSSDPELREHRLAYLNRPSFFLLYLCRSGCASWDLRNSSLAPTSDSHLPTPNQLASLPSWAHHLDCRVTQTVLATSTLFFLFPWYPASSCSAQSLHLVRGLRRCRFIFVCSWSRDLQDFLHLSSIESFDLKLLLGYSDSLCRQTKLSSHYLFQLETEEYRIVPGTLDHQLIP